MSECCPDCGAEFETERGVKAHIWQSEGCGERPYTNKENLERLYKDEKKSLHQIADVYGVDHTTIRDWMDKHDLERRDRVENGLFKVPKIHTTPGGYEQIQTSYRGEKYQVRIHRLLALMEHDIDEVANSHVHHKNDVTWDNRPENIELMDASDHAKHHMSAEKAEEMGRKGGLARHGLLE